MYLMSTTKYCQNLSKIDKKYIRIVDLVTSKALNGNLIVVLSYMSETTRNWLLNFARVLHRDREESKTENSYLIPSDLIPHTQLKTHCMYY